MNSWRSAVFNEHDLNIGVIGSPGVGKSTFINTIRRLKPTDPGAAPTGVVQTTLEPTSYAHPKNPHVKFWDLPGCGTPNFSKDRCLEAIQSMHFQFFIIMCCSRFTTHDLWFVNKVREAEQRFYFVRTKTDIDIRNYRHDYPQIQSKKVLEKLKSDCTAHLSTADLQNISVFLICKNPMAYDFFALEEEIITDLPERWRQALLWTLHSVSPKIIKDKASLLVQKSSWLQSANSAAITEVSCPQQPISLNTRSLCSEIMHYMKVLGLDDEGLKEISKWAGVHERTLFEAIKDNFWSNVSKDTLLKAMDSWNARVSADDGTQQAKFTGEDYAKSKQIIIEECIVSRLSSFTRVKEFLRYVIKSMEIAMLDVLTIADSWIKKSNWV